jgi:hypothetical protein
MAADREAITRLIKIRVVQHRTSDLLVALSDDLKGLMVPGRSDEELERKIPMAVREILEAQGFRVISVTADSATGDLPAAFMAREFVANAKVEAAH